MNHNTDNSISKITKSRLPIYTRKISYFAGKWPLKRNINIHNHNFFEMEIVIEGRAKTIINGTEYELLPGTLYIMCPTDTHSIIIDEGETVNVRNFCFLENAVSNEIIDFLISNAFDNIIRLSESRLKTICSLHEIVYDLSSEDDTEINILGSKAAELMMSMVIKEIKHTPHNTDNKHILNAISYMKEHFTEDISIDDVARYTGLSVPYFSSVFHASLGTKYKDYLTSLRIAHARKLLKNSNKSISEICYESGFNSFSSFHRAFVKIVHMTPSKYVHSVIPEFKQGMVSGHI
ncbi:MAG: helix-turn-helix domain-containing protein [Ruminococcaceae bacterium]|nr:helix-turn-helix domain-containing protein [Oscillospiraceae bacterium]